MSDTRAAIRELRSLGEKRSTQGLTDQEQSRLAELRERLGLPSEPAQSRSGGPRPGSAPSTTHPVAAVAVPQPPAGAVTLPKLGAPVGPAALPSFAPVPAPEPDAPALVPSPGPRIEPAPAAQQVGDLTGQSLPDLEAAVLGAMVQGITPAPADAPADLAPDLLDPGAPDGGASLEAPPELPADDLSPPTESAALDALPELPADDLSPPTESAALEALTELPADGLSLPTESAALEALTELPADGLSLPTESGALDALPELTADALEATTPGEGAGHEPGGTLPDLAATAEGTDPAATDGAELLAEAPGSESPWADGSAEPGEPGSLDPSVTPRRTSLAERIDAAVETLETEPTPGEEQPGWGAVPVAPESGEAGPPLEPEMQAELADLGAIPLDVADPAVDPGFPETHALIELSSADVVMLDGEPTQEPDLGGEPADPVPLAALHEFVGEQPADPRALAFDDQDDQPTLAAEELQATEAELASAPHAFHPMPVEPELEPDPPAPPVPAAPRVSVPRPPPGPPPARAPRPIPLTVESPPAPAPAAALAAPAAARTTTPPQAPAPPRAPTLSAARPEPPRRAGFGQSGPFARPPAVLMAPASLDVMDEDEGEGEPMPPPPPPATDVATGAEVFGGAYLNPSFVEGEHRVVLHTLEGQVRRGTVKDLDLLDAVIRLAQPGRPPEAIAADRVKAIFFMQEPGTAALPSAGRRIRVGFADGRQIVGFSEDVDSGEQGFFLVPADTRTHTARIYVFRAGVQSISAA